MDASPTHLQTGRVLTASAGLVLFAVSTAVTTVIANCPCSPPAPWAVTWMHGMARWQERTLWVLDPGGVRRSAMGDPRRDQPMIVIAAVAGPEAWALAIDAPGVIAEAKPIAGSVPASVRCPAEWLRPCLLGDGRRALLVDTQAVGRFLATPIGVAA